MFDIEIRFILTEGKQLADKFQERFEAMLFAYDDYSEKIRSY